MKKVSFGEVENFVPTKFCQNLNYVQSNVKYDTSKISFRTNKRGCVLEFPFDKDEKIFGLGLQLKQFEFSGKHVRLKPNADAIAPTGDSHAPVPFFVSTNGYGIFLDTARYIEINFGVSKEISFSDKEKGVMTSTEELYASNVSDNSVISIQIPVAKGIDVYIFEGKNITEIVSEYNMFSGGGCDVPDWGLGLYYRCYSDYNQKQVLDTARYFKENDIPCSVIGIEPGWQSARYSCSFMWNENYFDNPKEMLKSLYNDGYHVNLWEHAFISKSSPLFDKLKDKSGNYLVWQGLVPDFTKKETRELFAKHHKDNVAFDLIDGYKLDECDCSDYTGGWSFPDCTEFESGIDGEQYHSLFGTLYMQAIISSLNGKKTYSEVRNAGALNSSYPFVLYSDLYDHKDFVRGLVNAGFSGLLWTPEVRDAKTKEEFIRRLQTTVFSPQCLINAWYCFDRPWKDLDCETEVRELAKIRQLLFPSLRKAFDEYKITGKPPVRALVSDFTNDKETYTIDDEYLFCDNMLVAPILVGQTSRKVYLPQGKWVDFYTHKKVECGWFEVQTDNIPVYVKQ